MMKLRSLYIALLPFIFLACEKEVEINSLEDYKVELLSGNNQWAVAERFLPEPILVKVTDENGVGVSNVPIQWLTEDGELKSESHTNDEGIATAFWKMGYEPKAHNLVVSVVSGNGQSIEGSNISITAEGRDRTYLYTTKLLEGDGQIGKIYSPLEVPLKVNLKDDENGEIKNYRVDWYSDSEDWSVGGDEIADNDSGGYYGTTNDDGELEVIWYLGKDVGTQTLVAEIKRNDGTHVYGSPLSFTADAKDLTITAAPISDLTFAATRGTGIGDEIALFLEDEFNNTVNGYKVSWRSTASNWSLLSLNDENLSSIDAGEIAGRTDANGLAKVRWLLGDELGPQILTANIFDSDGNHVLGSPITYTASVYDLENFTDSRDGNTYQVINIDNTRWMTENLRYVAGESFCYNDDSNLCDEYGRLYTYPAAINACPTGWHLPEDDEWKALEVYLGMGSEVDNWQGRDDSAEMGLREGEWSGMEFKMAGYQANPNTGYLYNETEMDPWLKFARTKLWTATPNGSRAIGRAISNWERDGVGRYADSLHWQMSVRCVQD